MKIFTCSLAVAAAMTLCTLPLSAAEFVQDGLRYQTLTDSTVTVKKYVSGSNISIPSKVTVASESEEEPDAVYTVVAISGQAFYSADISSVSVPGTVTTIEQYAFWRSKLKEIKLAEGLESIGFGAFKECTQITDVKLPSTLKELGAVYSLFGMGGSVFVGCGALQSVEIPASVTEIPELTFQQCTALTEVKLNEGLTKIGERAFEECTALTEIDLPKSLTAIERAAFCKSGLANPVIPANVNIVPNSCFLWCYNMESFTIEEGIVEIGRQSFADICNFSEIRLPNSVEWIRTDAFQGNGNVTAVHLGSGLRRLGHASLALWAPDPATNVPYWALKDIYLASPVPPVHEQNDDHYDLLEDDFFFGGKEFTDELREQFYSEVKLHVPADAVETYKNDPIWGQFENIVADLAGIDSSIANDASGLTIGHGIVTSATSGIELYNTSGTLVRKSASDTMSLQDLPAGIYIIRSGKSAAKVAL